MLVYVDELVLMLIVLMGGGKMLVGFLLMFVELVEGGYEGLYIFYILLFKVLVVDICCNLIKLVEEMDLLIWIEDCIGDISVMCKKC